MSASSDDAALRVPPRSGRSRARARGTCRRRLQSTAQRAPSDRRGFARRRRDRRAPPRRGGSRRAASGPRRWRSGASGCVPDRVQACGPRPTLPALNRRSVVTSWRNASPARAPTSGCASSSPSASASRAPTRVAARNTCSQPATPAPSVERASGGTSTRVRPDDGRGRELEPGRRQLEAAYRDDDFDLVFGRFAARLELGDRRASGASSSIEKSVDPSHSRHRKAMPASSARLRGSGGTAIRSSSRYGAARPADSIAAQPAPNESSSSSARAWSRMKRSVSGMYCGNAEPLPGLFDVVGNLLAGRDQLAQPLGRVEGHRPRVPLEQPGHACRHASRRRGPPSLQTTLQALAVPAGGIERRALRAIGSAPRAAHEPAAAVGAHVLDQRHQGAALLGQRVLDPRRHLGVGVPLDDPASSSARRRSDRVRGLIPSSDRSSSQKRRLPSARSRITRSVHLPEMISAQQPTGQGSSVIAF